MFSARLILDDGLSDSSDTYFYHILIIEPQLTAINHSVPSHSPFVGRTRYGSVCKIENGSSRDLCYCSCESQLHESITAASDLSGSVAALIGSADTPGGNRHFNEIPEKSICTSLPCPFLSLITAPQAEGI